MSRRPVKLALLALIAIIVVLFFKYDLGQHLTFESLKANQEQLDALYEKNTLLFMGGFVVIYIIMAALSLPGAAILTLAGGAVFGLGYGTVLVSIGSTVGATCAFLVARFFLQESVQKKFKNKLRTINRGIEKEGAFYLFTLRLIPAFPFFVINLVMGLTPMKTVTFFFVSQLGMLPGTLVYVNAGTQLSQIDSLKEVLSPEILFSFALLGLFPIIAKKVVHAIRK